MVSGRVWHAPTHGTDGWFVVVGASFLAALDDRAEPEVIDALWSCAQEPEVPIEQLVSRIPLESSAGVRSLAVVSFAAAEPDAAERTVTAVVRGNAVVDIHSVGGARRFSSGGVHPWMLADFRAVTAVVLCGSDEEASNALFDGGPALPLDRGTAHARRLVWATSAEQAAKELVDHPASRANTAPGHGQSGAGSARRFQYSLAGSTPVDLVSETLFGRHPRAPHASRKHAKTLVKVNSPEQAVSSTHLKLEQQGNAVIVTDLRSTNGTVIRVPGHEPLRLRPDEAHAVGAGATIDIGDGNIIEILLAQPDHPENVSEPSGMKGAT